MSDRTETARDRRARHVRTAALGVAVVGMGVLAVAIWSAAARAEAAAGLDEDGAEFSAYIEGLPIMRGLSENDEGYVVQLSEGARLAEARLTGLADPAVVRGFYAAALVQLGWSPSDSDPYVYYRGGERLLFLIEPRRGRGGRPVRGLEAVFVVAPDQGAEAHNRPG